MQIITSIIMAIIAFISGLFTTLPHVVLPWSQPTTVVEDRAEVLAIYRDIAAKNTDTELTQSMRITEYPSIPGSSSVAVQTAIDLAFGLTDSVQRGLPGSPANILPADLKSARAEYYNSGRTVVITLVPNEQTDGFDGQANAGPVGRTIGVMGSAVQGPLNTLSGFGLPLNVLSSVLRLHYRNPSVVVRADARTGEVISADYSYTFVMELPLPLIPNLRVGASYSVSKGLI